MKKIILLLALFAIISCNSNIKSIKAKKDVESYLNDKYGMIGKILVTEVSKPDSMYSPFDMYMAMQLEYSDLNLSASRYLNIVNDESLPSKQRLDTLDVALNLNDSLITKNLGEILFFCDHPDVITAPKNRIGVKATFTLGDKTNSAYFFYNLDGKSIGHSSIDNMKNLTEILEQQTQFEHLMRDIEYE